MFRNTVQPIKMFYADPVEVDQAELNKFVMVRPPSKKKLKELDNVDYKLTKFFENGSPIEEQKPIEGTDDQAIFDCIQDYLALRERKESRSEATIAAIGMVEVRDSYRDLKIVRKTKAILDEERNAEIKRQNASKENSARKIDNNENTPSDNSKLNVSKPLEDDGGLSELVEISSDLESSLNSSKTAKVEAIDIFVEDATNSNSVFNTTETLDSAVGQIDNIKKSVGEEDKSSLEIINEMAGVTNGYPQNRVGKKLSKDVMSNKISSLLKKVNKSD